MVKPAQYGYDRLDARLNLTDSQYYPEVTRAQADSMRTKYFAVRTLWNSIIVRVKAVLNGEGISAIEYAFYNAAAMELFKAYNSMRGESLAIEAQTVIQKWVARGLGQTVLETIRSDVFSIPAPTP